MADIQKNILNHISENRKIRKAIAEHKNRIERILAEEKAIQKHYSEKNKEQSIEEYIILSKEKTARCNEMKGDCDKRNKVLSTDYEKLEMLNLAFKLKKIKGLENAENIRNIKKQNTGISNEISSASEFISSQSKELSEIEDALKDKRKSNADEFKNIIKNVNKPKGFWIVRVLGRFANGIASFFSNLKDKIIDLFSSDEEKVKRLYKKFDKERKANSSGNTSGITRSLSASSLTDESRSQSAAEAATGERTIVESKSTPNLRSSPSPDSSGSSSRSPSPSRNRNND